MSLIPEGCNINGMTFDSCQLLSRHWVICANDVVVGDVNGEAVIGKVRFHLELHLLSNSSKIYLDLTILHLFM